MKNQAYVILLLVVLIIISIFAVTNVGIVQVNYFFWSGESPLILVILFSVLMGGMITAITGSVKFFQMQREIKHLHQQNEKLTRVLEKHHLIEELKDIQNINKEQNNKK